MTTSSGTTNYTYDALHRLETVTNPKGGVTKYSYDAVNNLVQTELPNGNIEVREYDDLDRLLLVESQNSSDVIASFLYTLDEVGNRIAVEEHDGRRVEYTYDEVYRLVSEDIFATDAEEPTRSIGYTYDNVGNRLQKDDSANGLTVYNYDDNDRLITENQDGIITTYTYDDNGNVLAKNNPTEQILYSWNIENRLVSADTDGDGSPDAEYQYNSDGIRVAQDIDGVETRFLIDTNQPYAQVVEEYTPDGNVEVLYVYGHDLISQLTDSQDYFYHVDGLGSTRALTNESGLVTDRYIYDAFGQIIEQVGTTENPYLFAGEWRDSETGIDYLRARYLDSATGRFLSRDTFPGMRNNPVSLHRYLYANANPVIFTDPSGLVTFGDFAAANKIQNILNTSIRLGNTFFNTLDKVDQTFSIIDSVWTVFKLASNPSTILPTALNNVSLSLLPDLNDAAISLRANSGRIVSGVMTKKLPNELAQFAKLFNEKKSPKAGFSFYPPSIFKSFIKTNIPTGLKIQGRPLVIYSNNKNDRLFGAGMLQNYKKKDSNSLQFFRMDYGAFNHPVGGDGKNWDTWQDGQFHFHIKKD